METALTDRDGDRNDTAEVEVVMEEGTVMEEVTVEAVVEVTVQTVEVVEAVTVEAVVEAVVEVTVEAVVVEGAVAAAVDRVLSSQRRSLEFSLVSGISYCVCHLSYA